MRQNPNWHEEEKVRYHNSSSTTTGGAKYKIEWLNPFRCKEDAMFQLLRSYAVKDLLLPPRVQM